MIDPKGDAQRLRQLPLDLQIEEVDPEAGGFISPEEAQRLSEMARMAFEALQPAQDGGSLAWMDEYRKLREAGWNWRVACYIAWAASPKKGRYPKTQDDLATKLLGLNSDRQIGKWRKANPVIDETIGMLQAAPLINHRRDIYEALIESATSGSYRGHNDRKLALEIMGDYVPRSMVKFAGKVSGKGITEKSDAELEALLGEHDIEPGAEEGEE